MLDFKPQKMVGWFDIKQLAGTAVKAGLSSIFGSYADKRESIAAISEFEIYDYSATPELWIDYISDLGDGFDATYSMAQLLAQPYVNVKQSNGSSVQLPKARLLILGGDQVYPVATRETYNNRFKGPYETAWPRDVKVPEDDMFALAGNHDWYDGLTNFIKLFCQNRTTGNWRTKQNRSYFAIKLTANTWLWGIDIQLEADIDKPQLDYFDKVAIQYMNAGDKVVLCTAEPSWVYNTTVDNDQSYKNLSFFECRYIQDKDMQLIVTLAGDLHHYAHYKKTINAKQAYHKITAGGGGAFMHPTHNLPDELKALREGDFKLQQTFPDKATSRSKVFGNWKFFYHNWSFGSFMAIIYLLIAWLLEIGSKIQQSDIMLQLEKTGITAFSKVLAHLLNAMVNSPPVLILTTLVLLGLWKFSAIDRVKSKAKYVLGIFHGLLHLCLVISLFWGFAYLNYNCIHLERRLLKVLVLAAELFFAGGIIGSCLMGFYLMLANLLFGVHDNEAYSALKIPHYKNFLRMQVKDNVLTIYPVGVPKTARWKYANDRFTTEDKLEPELIEREPIVVPLG